MFSLYSQTFLVPESLILSLSFHTHFTFPAQNSITHFLCIIFFTVFLSFCVPLWSLISCTWSSGFLHFSFHYHNLLFFCRTSYPSFWLMYGISPTASPQNFILFRICLSLNLWLLFVTNVVVRVIIIFMFPLQFKILCYHSSL
jgi:hypothetical protein